MSTEMTIGEYIEKMRMRRDPPPSPTFMSLEAGLSASAIRQIQKGIIKRPTGDTIRKIADRWGTPDDYAAMMRLAGHPVPEAPSLDAHTQQIVQASEQWSPAQRELLASLMSRTTPEALAHLLRYTRELHDPEEDNEDRLEFSDVEMNNISANWDTLFQVVMRLSPGQRRRWIARSILRLEATDTRGDSPDADAARDE